MISHELRCIFVHIPRCAGTSVETWLCGRDWWEVEPSTKHLIASQARRIYAKWWNEYFKFSIVRDPYTRSRSLQQYSVHFGLNKQVGKPIDFSGYERLFGRERVIEHDHRFARRENIAKPSHRPRCVYGNMLDETLDYVGRFENLAEDMAFVRRSIGISRPFDFHMERSPTLERESLAAEDRAWIASAYAEDFASFGYAVGRQSSHG